MEPAIPCDYCRGRRVGWRVCGVCCRLYEVECSICGSGIKNKTVKKPDNNQDKWVKIKQPQMLG